MLNKKQQQLYDAFYQSTHQSESLDEKTEALIGLAAAMALDCQPCTAYYLKWSKQVGVTQGEVSEVLAKVMAVAAGQKRLQADEVMRTIDIDLPSSQG